MQKIALALCLSFGFVTPSAVFAQAQTPAPPKSVEAFALAPTAIRTAWLPAPGASAYRVLRDGAMIAQVPGTATQFDDTAVAPNTTHSYVVTAQTDSGFAASPPYVERSFAPFPDRTGASYDVVVVQASSSGAAAAYEAARRGLRVALVEPTTRLGGMPVNGLSATDIRDMNKGGGFFTRFRERVTKLYAAEGITADGRKYEPRIAHQAMKSLLYEPAALTIYRRMRPVRVITRAVPTAPERRRIAAVVMEELDADGRPTGQRTTLRGTMWVDATDCGDIAARAGARFRIGREPRTPQEPHNGMIYYDRKDNILLPGSTGRGDRRIQSYAYLLTVKDYGAGVDKTIPKPEGYRREDYLDPALPDWKSTWAASSGTMPSGKYELNQHPKGGDFQGINYGYPTGNYAERARVEKLYRNRILGYLYFIQTEYGMRSLGLPDDEYRDSGGFPPLLYVREGRRIIGEQMPVEADITSARTFTRPESVGVGDYPMDSHAVRPKTDTDPRHLGEGEWWLFTQTPWHNLPYGVMVPQGLDNVYVTTAVSSTHVSYGTYRMEPVRMAFGQAAGAGCWLALRYGPTAREVPARQVQEALLPHPANPDGDPNVLITYFSDVPPAHLRYREIQYMACRGFLPEGYGTPENKERFAPDAPTTEKEAAHWCALLAQRGSPSLPLRDHDLPDSSAPINRAAFVHLLHDALKGEPDRPQTETIYADISPETPAAADADFLYRRGIDTRLLDGWNAYAPNGRLYFKPDAPVTHADAVVILYMAQIGLGPLFDDHPLDLRNERRAR